MKEQKGPRISYYERQYTFLTHKADNAITLIEMGQPEKAKELLKFALMRAEQEFYDDLDADYPE